MPKLIARRNKRGNLNKELGILPIKSKITLENYKFGYKLKNKELPKKTTTLCYLDSKNKSLIKEHKYQTRHKTFPNLPKNANKTYINSFLCMVLKHTKHYLLKRNSKLILEVSLHHANTISSLI